MRSELPSLFIERLHDMYGAALVAQIEKTFAERPTTFRVNTIKTNRKNVMNELERLGFKTQPVAWYADAFILKNKSKRELTETALYENGHIYIQSLASMVPPLVLAPMPGEVVLDLTAAPGSKTSQMAAMMEKTGELVANDNNKIRFFKLKHNMEVLGVVGESAWRFSLHMQHGAALVKKYKNYFDKILLDAPCSAEARFIAGDSTTYGYWSERKIKEMAYKQRQLLLSVWGALKPGGTLVYSTCTLAPEENEVQIERLLERYKDVELMDVSLGNLRRLPTVTKWGNSTFSDGLKKCVRILPTDLIEGFFVAKLRKK